MKEIKYIFLLGLTLMLGSCQKEEIMMYQQRAGVYFSTRSMAYSLLKIRVSIRHACVCRWILPAVRWIIGGSLR